MTTSVAVVGASGKLGTLVCQLVHDSADFTLAAALDSRSDLSEMLVADVVFDVSLPAVSKQVIEFAVENGKSVLVGTSGWSRERIATVRPLIDAHPDIGVIFIANFSVGSALATHLATLAAPFYDSIEIVETHGVTKVDSPSGTAVNTAERIAVVRDDDIQAPHADQRARGQLVAGVPVHSLRMEGVLAKQDVVFGGLGETITITHSTLSNRSYETGILASLRALSSVRGTVVGLDQVINLSTES
jgi:4-hydroxy-tetrahydrodipicolinate reductase